MPLPNLLAIVVLLVGLPLNVVVTAMLLRRSREVPRNPVLHERMVVSAFVLILVVVFGLVFLNNDTLPPPLDVNVTKIITRLTVLGIAVIPALYWLTLYSNGRNDGT